LPKQSQPLVKIADMLPASRPSRAGQSGQYSPTGIIRRSIAEPTSAKSPAASIEDRWSLAVNERHPFWSFFDERADAQLI